MKKLFLFSSLFFLFACIPSPGQKDFDIGKKFYLEERWEESIPALREALVKDPKNQAFQDQLKLAEDKFVNQKLLVVVKDDNEDLKLNGERIEAIDKQLETIEALVPGHRRTVAFRKHYEEEKAKLNALLDELYAKGQAALRKDDLNLAKENFEELKKISPNYEGLDLVFKELQRRIGFSKAEDVRKLIVEEKYAEARKALDELSAADPDNQDIEQINDLLRYRDSYYFYVEKANKLLKENLLTQARAAYEKALTYNQLDPYAKNQIVEINRQIAEDFYYSGKKAMILGDLLASVESFKKAMASFPDILKDTGFLEANDKLIKELELYIQKALKEKHWGTALALELKIKSIHDTRSPEKQKKELVEAEVRKNLMLKLGLLVFDEPKAENAKGKLFSDLLYAGLLENKSTGLTLLNQEFITPTLVKGKKKTSGLVDSETQRYLYQTIGVSHILTGKILFLDLNSVDTPKVDLRKIPVAPNQAGAEKQYRLLEVKSGSAKKTSSISVLYSLYDASTGDELVSEAIEEQETASDDYTSGLESEGIASDPLEIPSDGEMVSKVMKKAVKSLLANLSEQVSQSGNFYLKRATYFETQGKPNEQVLALFRAKFLLPNERHGRIDELIDEALHKIIVPKK